jgi:hypothetical protein
VPETGTRVPSCVDVDADGDGESDDSELNSVQRSSLASAFGAFIQNNRGADLSRSGVFVSGAANPQELNMVRAVSQFVGYAFQQQGGDIATTWNSIDAIFARTTFLSFTARAPAFLAESESGGRIVIVITGRSVGGFARNPYESPGDLARLIIHEPLHLLYPRGLSLGQHQELDARARNLLSGWGLAGSGCSAGFGFPGCSE